MKLNFPRLKNCASSGLGTTVTGLPFPNSASHFVPSLQLALVFGAVSPGTS